MTFLISFTSAFTSAFTSVFASCCNLSKGKSFFDLLLTSQKSHPEMLHKSIGPDTKVVGINVMDPLGMAPVTTTMSPEKFRGQGRTARETIPDILR